MRGAKQTVGLVLLLAVSAFAQDNLLGPRRPSVTLLSPGLTTVTGGKAGQAHLRFRISPGFHINSNTPKSEFLIPTVLKVDAPTDIVAGKITYPTGEEMSFPFAPNEKLSVYSGEFAISVLVRPLQHVLPSKYMFRGQLRYQACDNAACYPPKTLPVQFEVKVAKAAAKAGVKNPAQSPHAHR